MLEAHLTYVDVVTTKMRQSLLQQRIEEEIANLEMDKAAMIVEMEESTSDETRQKLQQAIIFKMKEIEVLL